MTRRPSRRTFLTGAALAAASAGTLAAARRAEAAAWETVIDGSFASYATLESHWNYLYPWGSDHNGTARMYASPSDHNHVYLEGSTLTLLATRITWDEGNSSADPHLPIRYHSGAVHARHQVLVDARYPNYEVKGEFQAPSAPGTWPAFWLTGVNSWPPESDVVEFKGDARNWFNTFRSPSDVDSTIVSVPNPGAWHSYRAWITMVNSTDVEIHYYLDDQWRAVHRGAGFVGKPLWIIYNLQMEGSSGGSGPSSDTHFRARNVYVGRSVG
ncbi:glycoside hydrolase [Streptomyces sp. 4N509B]|uniref:glycoside hydrolase n=1 Tax=Streptomyces sp. 4N509B TaxID=3457413 RepID=UPI003FD1A011